jgi:hypothetical protein
VGVFIEEGKPSSWSGVFVLHDTYSDHPARYHIHPGRAVQERKSEVT